MYGFFAGCVRLFDRTFFACMDLPAFQMFAGYLVFCSVTALFKLALRETKKM